MSETQAVIAVVLGALSVLFALAAVVARNLLRCVAAFALSSAFLAGLFFHLGAPFAGALELSVGAGLVSVLFLVALILSGGEEEEEEEPA